MIPMAPGFFRPNNFTDADVLLLINGGGTNGSSSLVDSSQYNRTLTPSSGTQYSNAQSKFYGTSVKIPANGKITCAQSSDFNFTGGLPWQFDVWVYSAGHSLPDDFRWLSAGIGSRNLTSANEAGAVIGINTEGVSNDYYTSTGWNGVGFNTTWRLFTFSFDGTAFRIWINAVYVYGVVAGLGNVNWSLASIDLMSGILSDAYIDSLRILGRAEWNTDGNKTLPTSAFTP